ncbi:MAG: MaoC/PaaZ C-terminal domain-containing protein [Dehalococcoidia bacterium]|nr:MaoC/PaaZ C-terminal domain-containing protein [Dehalococcoidia bacterium]
MSTQELVFEDVEVGRELPSLRKEVDRVHMMMYGAATWDFIRLHYDESYVRDKGFPSPLVDGQMFGGHLAQLVMDWAGPNAFLKSLSFDNRVPAFAGDTLTCRGTVATKYRSGAEHVVECRLWVENQRGERVVGQASAAVALPSRNG